MALGAMRGMVVGMVMRQTAWLAGVGGDTIRLRARSLLDAPAFAGGLLLVLPAAAIAAGHPARRAARIDPASTRRADS